eukprot:TRINITY_DN6440_c0_g1_i1.p2 TRINITY_DN6440_c0_g1~~TRINITY_DN6440_c0_g1_i1.p2  ORF type:complete len:178 (-),score=28.23 TRINITY_DN6440_c0_g1_i1:12-503(-)
MELQTIITSHAGSGHQRWHQGFQNLFHPEERLPPYAVVVGVPLVDVKKSMGPTQFCPGKNLRFYQGYTCAGSNGDQGDGADAVQIESELGDITVFDYKLLHRGPANPTGTPRPMMSLVFSKLFFLNMEPVVNRAIPFEQTIHQRLYWEQFYYHPDQIDEMWNV